MRLRITLAALLAILLLPITAQAEDDPCPDPARPVHYSVLCLTEAESLALTATPAPNPAPAPSYSPYSWEIEQWRPMVAFYWGKHGLGHVDRMLRIMRCESRGLPWAYNRSGASGLFQIMPFWQRAWPGDYFNPWTNAAVAYQIWLTQGYAAWVCRG